MSIFFITFALRKRKPKTLTIHPSKTYEKMNKYILFSLLLIRGAQLSAKKTN